MSGTSARSSHCSANLENASRLSVTGPIIGRSSGTAPGSRFGGAQSQSILPGSSLRANLPGPNVPVSDLEPLRGLEEVSSGGEATMASHHCSRRSGILPFVPGVRNTVRRNCSAAHSAKGYGGISFSLSHGVSRNSNRSSKRHPDASGGYSSCFRQRTSVPRRKSPRSVRKASSKILFLSKRPARGGGPISLGGPPNSWAQLLQCRIGPSFAIPRDPPSPLRRRKPHSDKRDAI